MGKDGYMGLRSWLRGILVRQPRKRAARRASTLITTSGQAAAPSSAFDDPGPDWEELPPVFVSSATTGMGREEILGYIESILKNMNDN